MTIPSVEDHKWKAPQGLVWNSSGKVPKIFMGVRSGAVQVVEDVSSA